MGFGYFYDTVCYVIILLSSPYISFLFTDLSIGLQTEYEHWNISAPVQDVSFFIAN